VNTLLDLIGDLLPFAAGVAVSPLPIIAVVLVLMGERSRAAGVAFLLGRLVGLSIVVGLIAVLIALIPEQEEELVSAGIRLLIGLALIGLAFKKWRSKPEGFARQLPGWMSALEQMPPPRIFVVSIVLSLINVKELLLIVGVGVTIGDADLPLHEEVIAVAVFVALASTLVAVPVIATLVAPKRMAVVLVSVRAWLVQHQTAVMSVVLLVIGALLAGAAIQDF
jgi:threonine/homoserine/homoserine lactone efflux protein